MNEQKETIKAGEKVPWEETLKEDLFFDVERKELLFQLVMPIIFKQHHGIQL